MSKRDFKRKVGQAVCNVTGALLIFAVPITACGIAQCICNIIL